MTLTGKTAIQNIPTNGIMDAMMAFESAGLLSYGDKGNPTQEELSATIAKRIGRVVRALTRGFSAQVGLPGAVSVSFDAGRALDAMSPLTLTTDVPGPKANTAVDDAE